MIKLIALGASLLSFHGAPHRTHHYWWIGVWNCTISTVQKGGTYRGTPYIQCVAAPAHWASTPQQLNPSDYVDPSNGAATYNPLAPVPGSN